MLFEDGISDRIKIIMGALMIFKCDFVKCNILFQALFRLETLWISQATTGRPDAATVLKHR
jgi:hypothetical protein